MHVVKSTKGPSEFLQYLLKLFFMLNIKIWYANNDVPDNLGIKHIKCNKVSGYDIYKKTLKDSTTFFVKNVVFQNVGLSWITNSKE